VAKDTNYHPYDGKYGDNYQLCYDVVNYINHNWRIHARRRQVPRRHLLGKWDQRDAKAASKTLEWAKRNHDYKRFVEIKYGDSPKT